MRRYAALLVRRLRLHVPARTALLILLMLSMPAPASAAEAPPAIKARSAELIQLFNGTADPAELFTPWFFTQVPQASLEALSRQIVAAHGAARTIRRIDPASANRATISVDFERAILRVELTLEPEAPHRIVGLLVTDAERKGDSLEAVAAELQTLPGRASLAVARLDKEAAPDFKLAVDADEVLAIGSSFKLFIVGRLVEDVKQGRRKWSDVVPFDRRSPTGGFLHSWPLGSPVTLHSLAALMISQSDNSATDTLLHLLGRERVEAMLPAMGVARPERARPLLGTAEASLLKAGSDETLLARWEAASESGKRAILAGPVAAMPPDGLDTGRLVGKPNAIETVEWFASASDLVRVMDWLRRNGDAQAHAILAINPGIAAAAARDFALVGYKGGSEVGVMNMTFLLRGKAGNWHALSGSWNNPDQALDEARFRELMMRAVSLLE